MRRLPTRLILTVAGLALVGGALALLATPGTASTSLNTSASSANLGRASSCCDPALEPGTGGNPFCFEGHTCCANGQWSCNNADGSPGCTACGTACGGRNAVCTTGADCCSGVCKANGRCK